ncbi:dNTP triphosphohydrolase [Sphingobacterium sp. PCS056]|uniref:deoxyguanosinetriphosphate triphosphohydrolase family protein n=1 Tax=Sphingobacterium sp. PCS056 TaxID=2931400 RepID=UPI00200CD46D|nr:dNTP triphosphohydrolase [Sphingobacterium sp. PCS056]UPZ35301.1 dNTP triphosphohydrolase [Sphingobacterium sp. PCS056]
MISTDLENYCLEKENELLKISNMRVDDTHTPSTFYYRDNADIDYSRVLYSSSCRRLQGKMQLFIPKSQVFYRNRLTHSLEVAQIAKTISKRLKLEDNLTVQTCALAHDIGNPPFGHAGEVFLSKVCSENPYEGNAQTFRILNKLEERHHDFNGLNLTIRTMLGVVKYLKPEFEVINGPDGDYKKSNKKFLYNSDYKLVTKWIEKHNITHKTIDCEIMDLSDEIAYAIHDLEDALKLKYFTIDELLYEFSIDDKYKKVLLQFKKYIVAARKFAEKASVYKTSEEYAMLYRKELTSILTTAFVNDIDLIDGKLGYKELNLLVSGLKALTFKAIKRQPDIVEYEQLGQHILTRLYELYTDKTYNLEMVLLPANYRAVDHWERKVQDYIGGMMDIYAIQQYEKYFGQLDKKGIYFK